MDNFFTTLFFKLIIRKKHLTIVNKHKLIYYYKMYQIFNGKSMYYYSNFFYLYIITSSKCMFRLTF